MILPMYEEDTQEKVIYINTFSKSLVPSLRISYMVMPHKLLQKYIDTQSFYSCTVSSFEQYALAKFIADGYFERHINRMKNYYREQRTLVLNAIKNSSLNKISTVIERNAGTHFLLKIKTDMNNKQVFSAGIERDMQLSFYSDYSYAKSDNQGVCTLVFNYAGIARDKIEEVIHRLESIFIQD